MSKNRIIFFALIFILAIAGGITYYVFKNSIATVPPPFSLNDPNAVYYLSPLDKSLSLGGYETNENLYHNGSNYYYYLTYNAGPNQQKTAPISADTKINLDNYLDKNITVDGYFKTVTINNSCGLMRPCTKTATLSALVITGAQIVGEEGTHWHICSDAWVKKYTGGKKNDGWMEYFKVGNDEYPIDNGKSSFDIDWVKIIAI